MPADRFDQVFTQMVNYPAEKAARLYVSYARQIGASKAALEALGQLTTVTKEDTTMATAKKATKANNPTVKPAAKGEPATKAAKTPKPAAAEGKTTGPKPVRGPSAAQRFQELIREGKWTDDQIFAKVQEEFGLDDKKRSYVNWYRNYMRKSGETVPNAQ